jgi:L,D-transpeptidase YcbB
VKDKLRSGQLEIRQRPGPDNALGLVKFDFPNQFDVYTHGTLATELFSRSRRDFSHGCIRVEDSVVLVQWILRDRPEWTAESIRSAMYGDATIRVAVLKPIPVLIPCRATSRWLLNSLRVSVTVSRVVPMKLAFSS